MNEDICAIAIQSILNSQQAFCKFLSANDTGATGGHQFGILISKAAHSMLFSEELCTSGILKRQVRILWQNSLWTDSAITYYSSKGELRITRFGRGFPFLRPDDTGSLFILTRQDVDSFSGFFIEKEEDINLILDTFGISSTETNKLIERKIVENKSKEQSAIEHFIEKLTTDFPSSEMMSHAAREIQNSVYNHQEYILSNPDRKLIEWTNTEYALFRAIEHSRYGKQIAQGFCSVNSFISMANIVLNRRKSRAGKSLENHLSAIFDANHILYSSQAVTEGNKKPDFLFPSQAAYHTLDFPSEKLISLAAKTTCKDRWRQILNEADRLRGRPKYLCTLQQGISPSQMDEMHSENVILIVPKAYIKFYPKDRQDQIWTLHKFISFVRETESL